jgi:hypothetical protein
VYIGINAHFQLSTNAVDRSNGYEAAVLLDEQWESTRVIETDLIADFLRSVDT